MQGHRWISGQIAPTHLKMSWIKYQINEKDSVLANPPPFVLAPPSSYVDGSNFHRESPPPPSSSGTRISPALLFVIVILAVLFFISGLLHLLVRFLTKSPSSSQSNRNVESSTSEALQRQLQQLFHLHDSGLDQAFIDALPVFSYKEVVGPKEPFDCAVCLCEFTEADQLRLLPMCSHAFHLNCIDTWLLSNSSCPLWTEKGVFPVRLGKFRKLEETEGVEAIGETSSSKLDARRCYSLGSYQYVVGDAKLRVVLSRERARNREKLVKGNEEPVNAPIDETENTDGKKISIGTKTDSYSVSKIWLWSKKGKFASSSDAQLDNSSPPSLDLLWMRRNEGV